MKPGLTSALPVAALLAAPALADPAEIVAAEARQTGTAWTVSVTLRHGDTGWDDYADGWEVLSPDGQSLGLRVLAHPHVEEQPFTRSLSGIAIPDDLSFVLIRARTNTDGWGEAIYRLDLRD